MNKKNYLKLTKKTTQSNLAKYSNHKDDTVRTQVAIYTNQVDILIKLSSDFSAFVRSAVAFNEKTPIYILEKLANDAESMVREGVAYSGKVEWYDYDVWSVEDEEEENRLRDS